jgi:hypothetical protein
MARTSKASTKSKKRGKNDQVNDSDFNIRDNRAFRKSISNINTMIGQANLSLYGTDRTSDVDALNAKFQSLLNEQVKGLTKGDNEDITSFLGQVISSDNKSNASEEILSNQFMQMSGSEFSTVQSFIYDAYRNRLLEQSDLHQVASQLIELSEAILITRDAIISADVVEGRMSRTLSFDNIDDDSENDNISIIEKMEKKFGTLEKIKNFIIPKALEYGSYFAYTIPYSKLFNNFMNDKLRDPANAFYRESTLMESFSTPIKTRNKNYSNELNTFIESTYKQFSSEDNTGITKEDFSNDLKTILGNITVCNESVPLPILEEGINSIEYFKENAESYTTERKNSKKDETDWFNRVNSGNFKLFFLRTFSFVLSNSTKLLNSIPFLMSSLVHPFSFIFLHFIIYLNNQYLQ